MAGGEETRRLLQWPRRVRVVVWTKHSHVRREVDVFKEYLGGRKNLQDLCAFGR